MGFKRQVGHQVGLELSDIHVEGTVKAQRRGQRRDDLGDQAVEVGVRRALNVEGAAADVIHSLIVEHDGNVGVLQQGVRRQHGVVGLNDRGGDLRAGVHCEAKLGLLAIVNGQALQQQGAQTGASATTNGVEDQEALQTRAVVSKLADAVKSQVDNLLANCGGRQQCKGSIPVS